VGITPPPSSVLQKRIPPNQGGGKMKRSRGSVIPITPPQSNETVCGMHTALLAFGRSNEPVCGVHTVSLAFGSPNEPVCEVHTVSLAFGRPNEPVCGVHTGSF